MSKKKKTNLKKPETSKDEKQKGRSPKAVEVVTPEDERAKEAALAKTYLRPTVLAAATIKGQYANQDEININALIDELGTQVTSVKEGNMGRAEAMLISQAHTLDALFAELISRSRLNMGEYFPAACKYMTLAFKAQSQCRCTLEALAEIKNPKPYIQNNRAQYQQVNNGVPEPRAHGENSKSTNGLLEDQSNDGQWLDTGAPETTSENDKELEAVEAKHWPQK